MRHFTKEEAKKELLISNNTKDTANARKRIRFIGHKYSSLSGRVSFTKRKELVQFESSLERDLVYILEFNREVSGFLEQPMTIKYEYENKTRKYTPDFLVQYHEVKRPDEIIEVKYIDQLEKNYSKLKPKFDAADSFCKKSGLVFKVMSEVDIRSKTDYLENIKFLARYKYYYECVPNHILKNTTNMDFQILDSLDETGPITISSFIASFLKKNDLPNEEMIFRIWYLLSNNFIHCDLQKKLGQASVIWTKYL